MGTSLLLDKFLQDVSDPLLKALIRVYEDKLDFSDDERINSMVAKLEEILEERGNASHSA
jgi:hypothetical protein